MQLHGKEALAHVRPSRHPTTAALLPACLHTMSSVLQEFIIKDLTTGQMYGLDEAHSTAPDQSSTHLTDIASGRKITLNEFDGVLGHGQAFSSKVSRCHCRLSYHLLVTQLPLSLDNAPISQPSCLSCCT